MLGIVLQLGYCLSMLLSCLLGWVVNGCVSGKALDMEKEVITRYWVEETHTPPVEVV